MYMVYTNEFLNQVYIVVKYSNLRYFVHIPANMHALAQYWANQDLFLGPNVAAILAYINACATTFR